VSEKLTLEGRVGVYNDEQSNDLKLLDYIDYSNGDYRFDYRAVWVGSDGRLWTARDSGCSCPSPFEDTRELDRLWSFDVLEEERIAEAGAYPSEADFAAFKVRVLEAFANLSAGGGR
jgi:hypothetical protein